MVRLDNQRTFKTAERIIISAIAAGQIKYNVADNIIHIPYNLKDAAKRIFTMNWDPDIKAWQPTNELEIKRYFNIEPVELIKQQQKQQEELKQWKQQTTKELSQEDKDFFGL